MTVERTKLPCPTASIEPGGLAREQSMFHAEVVGSVLRSSLPVADRHDLVRQREYLHTQIFVMEHVVSTAELIQLAIFAVILAIAITVGRLCDPARENGTAAKALRGRAKTNRRSRINGAAAGLQS